MCTVIALASAIFIVKCANQKQRSAAASVYPSSLEVTAGKAVFIGMSDGGLWSRSEDATWKFFRAPAPLMSIVVTHESKVWGLYSWRGIHEPSSAAIVASEDGGAHWNYRDMTAHPMPIGLFARNSADVTVLFENGDIRTLLLSNGRITPVHQHSCDLGSGANVGAVSSREVHFATADGVWSLLDDGSCVFQSIPGVTRIACGGERCMAQVLRGHVYWHDTVARRWSEIFTGDLGIEMSFEVVPGVTDVRVLGVGSESVISINGWPPSSANARAAPKELRKHGPAKLDGDGILWWLSNDGLYKSNGAKATSVWRLMAPPW